jgi:dihydrofolate reductase
MGKVVVTEFISLDGVIEAPGGGEEYVHAGWSFKFDRGDEGNKFKVDELNAADAQLLGRVTYQGFASVWPNMNSDPFGEKMNSMPKYVVSSTLEEADWTGSILVKGDLATEIGKLKDTPGKDLLLSGSGRLLNGLRQANLIDLYRFMLHPIVLGTGARLFPDGIDRTVLELTHHETFDSGIVILEYAAGAS